MRQISLNAKQATSFRFIGWFFFVNSLFFWLVGFGYLKSILWCSTLFNNLMVVYESLPAKIFIVVFWIINYLSYMTLLAFIPACFLFLLAYVLPFKRFLLPLSVLVATLSLVLLVINNYVFALFKFHLNTTVVSIFINPRWYDAFDLSASELQFFALLLLTVVLLEGVIACWVWKKTQNSQASSKGRSLVLVWLVSFIWGYLVLVLSIYQENSLFGQQTAKLPWYNQLIVYLIPDKNAESRLVRFSEGSFAQPLFSESPMQYPLHPMVCHKPKKPLNIIMIMVDSLRFDSLQSQYMPHLARWAEKGWQFRNHISGGNATQPGLFSLFYSLPSSYWTAALQQKISPFLIRLLQEYQYKTKILWSNEIYNPPFDKTIYLGIEGVSSQGVSSSDIGNNDRKITQEALSFLQTTGHQGPFFLNLFYDAVHGWCREQSFPALYQPTASRCLRVTIDSEAPIAFYNRYLNAVHFVDEEIGKILALIEKQGYLQNSLVIITSDHGEEFNDNQQDYWGHASNFSPTQVHIPLLIHWPKESPRIISHLTSSYDLVPTVLQRLYNCENPKRDYSIGQDLLHAAGRFPFVITGSYNHMGFVEPDRITTLRVSGTIGVADPNTKPILGAKVRRDKLEKALELMRRYYVK